MPISQARPFAAKWFAITGAELKWGTIYKSFVRMIDKGESCPTCV